VTTGVVKTERSPADTAPRRGTGQGGYLESDGRRFATIALLLFALALAATLLSSTGKYTLDNRFEFYWAPDHLLSRYGSIWDSLRGIGLFRWDWWPTAVGPLVLRAIGLAPWVTERVWHSLELTLGGVGMVALLRCFRPRVALEHVVAAALYTFSPLTAGLLVPSNIFLGYALAPWLLVVFVRGIRDRGRWRWPAVFALLVFVSGNVNYPGFPGLAFAVLPAIPMAVYLVHVERSARWPAIGAWLWRAAVLSLVVSAAALVTTGFGSDTLSNNLAVSETPRIIASASSWTESWRGLGFWFLYARDARGYTLTNLDAYFTSIPVLVASFLTPVAALAAFALCRTRLRIAFGGIMVLGLAIMVGAFPPGDPSPYGRVLLEAFESVPFVSSLRNSYKAGPALAMGLAALVGLGAAELVAAVRARRPRLTKLGVLAVAALIIVSAFPFWRGDLYSTTRQMTELPHYWDRALHWLERAPGAARVLVVPSTELTEYTWGSPGDDIFEALLDRRHVARATYPLFQGTKESANLVGALDDYLENGSYRPGTFASYRPGTFAPIARRIGIKYVLVRNDLDWQATGRPAPSSFEGLRHDPELELVRTFGVPGENVSTRGDFRLPSPLPPVEVYAVKGPVRLERAVTDPPLLVSGDGAAWPTMAAAGTLSTTGPVRYTADLDPGALARSLETGSELVVTDTNRRQVAVAAHDTSLAARDYTLGRGERRHGVDDLFGVPRSQTVAIYPDATRITASSHGSLLGTPQPWWRPSNAFDGDPDTAWETGGFVANPTGASITVNFPHPRELSSVSLTASPGPGPQRHVTRATVLLSDGTRVPADLSSGTAKVRFRPQRTRWVKVVIDEVHGPGLSPVGLSEIAIPGADLREVIEVPDDVVRAASNRRELADALAGATVSYQFHPLATVAGLEEVEPVMRRAFRTLGTRQYSVTGAFAPSSNPAFDPSVNAAVRAAPDMCHDALRVDGTPVAVRVQSTAPGDAPRFVPCTPLTLAPGGHILETEPSFRLAWVELSTGSPPPTAPPAGLRTTERGSDRVDVRVRAPQRASVIIGQSFDPTWHATVDGDNMGEAVALDTQAGWIVHRRGVYSLDAEVTAQPLYLASLAVTSIGLATCLFLAIRRTRRGDRT